MRLPAIPIVSKWVKILFPDLDAREKREWLTVLLTLVLIFGGLAALASTTAVSSGAVLNLLVGFAITLCIFSLLGLGLQLQFGYAGILNLGFIAFAGLAAYTVGIVWRHEGLGLAQAIAQDPALQAGTLACVGVVAGGVVTPLAGLFVQRLMPRYPARVKQIVVVAVAVLAGAIAVALFLPMDETRARDAVILFGMLLGVALATGLAVVLAIPAIRLREDYLAIVTLGAAELLEAFYRNELWLTGGTEGILNLHNPVATWALNTPWWEGAAASIDPNLKPVGLALLGVAVLLVGYFYILFEALIRSPWGRVLRAIREDDAVASALGKDVNRFRLQALVLGGTAAAMAGYLIAFRTSTLFPGNFERALTFFTWIALVVGGIANNKGVIAGAAIIMVAVPELARYLRVLEEFGIRDVVGPGQALAAGVMLIVVMMLRPQGLVGRKEELQFGR